MDQIVCLACYFLETSIDPKIVSCLSLFPQYKTDEISCILNCFCAISWSNVCKNEDIRSVGPSQPGMMGLPIGLGLWIFVIV